MFNYLLRVSLTPGRDGPQFSWTIRLVYDKTLVNVRPQTEILETHPSIKSDQICRCMSLLSLLTGLYPPRDTTSLQIKLGTQRCPTVLDF